MHEYELPTTPGAIIGYRKNGQPIRLIAGGSEPAPEPQATGAPADAPPASEPTAPAATQPPAATEPAAPAPSGQEPPASQQQARTGGVEELPSWAQKEFKDLRAEAASNRVKAKEAADAVAAIRTAQDDQRLAMARALGFANDEPPTPEQLAEQLNAAQAERDSERDRARQTAVELAVFRHAATAGADGNALLDSRSFLNQVGSLDPGAENFSEQVAAAIAAATDSHPQYKLAPATPPPPAPPTVPRSGGEFTGAPSTPRQWTQEDVDHASPSQLQEAINKGFLENLGFGPRRASRR